MKGANYYGEVFAVREQGPSIPQSAGLFVELKTNVIVSPSTFDLSIRLGLSAFAGVRRVTVGVPILHTCTCTHNGSRFAACHVRPDYFVVVVVFIHAMQRLKPPHVPSVYSLYDVYWK